MSTGRKRYRPCADTSIEEDEDFQSNKFVKLRNRTRLPVKQGRNSKAGTSSVSGSNSCLFRGNVSTGSQNNNIRKARGSSDGGGRKYAKASFSTLFTQKDSISDTVFEILVIYIFSLHTSSYSKFCLDFKYYLLCYQFR